MSRVLEIPVEQIKPDRAGVLQTQGIPPGIPPSPKVSTLYNSAEELFFSLAAPAGIMTDVSIEMFKGIYSGEGLNAPDTPLAKIFPKAAHLALFAFTLGIKISQEIERQLKSKGLALGYMLDAVASYCTDKASLAAEEIFLNSLFTRRPDSESHRVLLYSPGYCGWHISGQKNLFNTLKPEGIGIHLNRSCLMVPLKSISGVLVAGESKIHQFSNTYPFCGLCRTKTCRERVDNL